MEQCPVIKTLKNKEMNSACGICVQDSIYFRMQNLKPFKIFVYVCMCLCACVYLDMYVMLLCAQNIPGSRNTELKTDLLGREGLGGLDMEVGRFTFPCLLFGTFEFYNCALPGQKNEQIRIWGENPF